MKRCAIVVAILGLILPGLSKEGMTSGSRSMDMSKDAAISLFQEKSFFTVL
jgi:hypothetical protein